MIDKLYLDEMVQTYFDRLYHPFTEDIQYSRTFGNNETYGEIYYYSAAKILDSLHISEKDHFLDIGSGLGKVVFQTLFTTDAHAVTGIEINATRHNTAFAIQKSMREELPALFKNRTITLMHDDFLRVKLPDISIVYLCSTVFSFELLHAMGKKINEMNSVQKIISFRKLPHLDNFILHKKLFVQCSWDKVPCFLYFRIR